MANILIFNTINGIVVSLINFFSSLPLHFKN